MTEMVGAFCIRNIHSTNVHIAHTCLNWELFFHCLCFAIFSNFIWDRYVLQPWYMIFACAIEQITAAVGNSVVHSIISYWNICICACNTKQWVGVKTKHWTSSLFSWFSAVGFFSLSSFMMGSRLSSRHVFSIFPTAYHV